MPREEILDPQGKATLSGLKNMGFTQMDHVRIGKRIELEIEAADSKSATVAVNEACRKLLANTVIETYDFELSPA
jgi:phosphoribosylformylglycinamidine synthase